MHQEETLQQVSVVVVKWSACSPFATMIRVRFPHKSTIFLLKLLLKRTKKQKMRPVFKRSTYTLFMGCGAVELYIVMA